MGKSPKNGLTASIKRGVTSLFVCAVVVLPLLFVARWPQEIANSGKPKDPRTVITLPAMTERPVDTQGAPRLFEEPLISITFDDGWESNYSQAAELLMRYGIRGTHYVISGVADNHAYMSRAQLLDLHKHGQEIACHTVSHQDITTLDDAQLSIELHRCQTDLNGTFGQMRDFASPYGHFDAKSITEVKQYYRSHRNTNADLANGVDYNDVNVQARFDRYSIISMSIRPETTLDELKEAVAYAQANNGWLVLTYHQSEDGVVASFGLDTAVLKEQLAYLSSTPVKIAPVGTILDNARTIQR